MQKWKQTKQSLTNKFLCSAQIRLPAPTWQFRAVCNSRVRESDASVDTRHIRDAQTFTKTKHSDTKISKNKFKKLQVAKVSLKSLVGAGESLMIMV